MEKRLAKIIITKQSTYKIALIILLFTLTQSGFAQTADLLWGKAFGSGSTDYARAIATDALGNIYITGQFRQTVDFNPGPGVANLTAVGADVFIQKLDANGNFVWAKSIGGTNDDYGQGIAIDALGNVNITGHYFGACDFDPGPGTTTLTAVGQRDIFILQLTANGDFNWAKSFGGNTWDYGYGIATDALNNIYITGGYAATVDFNPGSGVYNMTAAGGVDVFVEKLDVNGNFIWANSIGNTQNDYGYGIHIQMPDTVYITGQLTQPSFNQDVFIWKLNASGSTVWMKQTVVNAINYGYSITTDVSGNILTTGSYSGTSDFDPGAGTVTMTSAGASDIFVQKLNPSGNLLWARSMGGASNDGAKSITTDTNCNVYLTGGFSSNPVDFDPGLASANVNTVGVLDHFIEKLDNSGNFVWVKTMGSVNEDEGQFISVDNFDNIYVTGHFSNTVDLDPGTGTVTAVSNGGYDYFVQKFRQCTTVSTNQTLTICNSDSIIVGSHSYNTSGIYTDVLTTTHGCDSVVTTDLTVRPVITSSQAFTICYGDNISVGINTYNATGVYSDIFTSTATGCDSTVTTNLTVLPANTFSQSPVVCAGQSFTVGSSSYNATGTYTDVLTSIVTGCDSTVTTHITLYTVDISTTLLGITITAVATGASYQWLDCNNAYAVIAGETNQSYTPNANGDYAVKITMNNCTDTSSCVNITSVGIESSMFEDNIRIFPNPTEGAFTIDFSCNNKNFKIEIIDIAGKKIKTINSRGKQAIVEKGELKSGIYFVRISDENNNILNKKIIIQ